MICIELDARSEIMQENAPVHFRLTHCPPYETVRLIPSLLETVRLTHTLFVGKYNNGVLIQK